jgi:hypothetical protein
MSNVYYPMKLIGFCMKYNNGFYLISSVHVCVLKCSDRNMLLCESYVCELHFIESLYLVLVAIIFLFTAEQFAFVERNVYPQTVVSVSY